MIPAGGIGSRLWPLSRADAPKFLHDLTGSGPDAAARHLGPARAALRAGPHRGGHGSCPPRGGRDASCPTSPTRTSSSSPSRAIPPPRSVWPPRSCPVASPTSSSARSPPTTSSAARTFSTAPCSRPSPSPARDTSARSASRRPRRRSASATSRRATSSSSTGAPEAALVERFVEKPDLETAQEYFADRSYLWNAGMFISRADVLLGEIAENEPAAVRGADGPRRGLGRPRRARARSSTGSGRRITKIAIDYAVAEPAADEGALAVIPGHFDWDDVGDFASLAKLNSHGRKNELAILGEQRARARGRLQRHRRLADAARDQRDRRARTS